MTDAEEARLAQLAIDAITKNGIATMTREQRTVYLTALGQAAHQLLRSNEGDGYVRGWLETALDDLKRPAFLAFRKLDA
jgi:hypothetical protein